MSELDSQEAAHLFVAASHFKTQFERWDAQQRPSGMQKARTLAAMATLLQAADNHDKKLQEEFDAKTSLSEPPF